MIRRMTALLLAVMMLCGVIPMGVAADTVEIVADNIDTSRGTGELVIYTDRYGKDTGTNFWGAEAVVGADNVVEYIGTGRSEIPEGGFVISGHDNEEEGGVRMKAWVNDNIEVGDYVYYDPHTLKITVSDKPLDVEQSVFYTVKHAVDAVDKSREQDWMVMYTSSRGKTTGTNAFGYEVTVEGGMVVAVGGNNVAIPKNGFVISGHGTSKDWLRQNVIVGMKASYKGADGEITFEYSTDSVKQAAQLAMDNLATAIEDSKAHYVYADYVPAEVVLNNAKALFDDAVKGHDDGGSDDAFVKVCNDVQLMAKAAQNALCESYTVQYRGVWIRPSQRTAMEVDSYVKELKQSGINTVSIEGFFDNGVIMEVPDDCLYKKIARFNYDVLQAYIDACHKYGMECHLWMPIMCVGYAHDPGYANTVTAKRPEWLSLSQKGTPDNPNGFMMIDPANKEAREYLVSFYQYIVENYDIDCFELDYIRYYEVESELDFGYTEAAFAGFEEAYGHGVTPTYDREAAYWNDWCDYRRSCVTEMVKAVRAMIDEKAPHVLLSADVNPTRESARNNTYQDYPAWLEMGLLDMLHQMAYGDGYGEAIVDAVELGGDRTLIVTGLGVFTDSLTADDMERQAREDNLCGAYGDFYFEASSYLGDKVYDKAQSSVYRNEALAPFADPDASVTACLDYMQGRIDDVIVPLEGVTAAQATALTEAITAAKNAVSDATIEKAALAALKSAVDALENENAKAALTNDLYRAERIAMVLHAAPSSDDSTEDTAPTTAETPEAEDEGMSVTTIIIIVVVVILAIISGAFGVAKLLAIKKKG